MNRKFLTLINSVMFVILICATFSTTGIKISNIEIEDYTKHDPIYIFGNNQFTYENGVISGSGTELDPYIIEGWEIDIKTGLKPYGIFLCNTDSHVIIRNCKVYGGKLFDGSNIIKFGINLYGVKNAVIDGCISMENFVGIGIGPYTDYNDSNIIQDVVYSENIDIKNSIFSNNGFDYNGPLDYWLNLAEGRGISIDLHNKSCTINIENCVIHSNAGFGIDVTNKGNVFVRNCDITDSFVGIHHLFASGIKIEKCNIYKNTMTGILNEISSKGECIYQNNNIYGNLGITNHPITPKTKITGLAVNGNANVDATDNWWGDESGPYHKSENPDGKGNGISWTLGNPIHFEPWLKEKDNTAGLTSNFGPGKPLILSGENTGEAGEEYTYTTFCIDPNNDDLYYMWDFGDDTTSEWIGPYDSGEEVEITHVWEDKGTYIVKVKAKDMAGLESDWSDPLPVIMPKKLRRNNLLLEFLLKNDFFRRLIQHNILKICF